MFINLTQANADAWAESSPTLFHYVSENFPKNRMEAYLVHMAPAAYDVDELRLGDREIAFRVDEIGPEEIIELVGVVISYNDIIFRFSGFEPLLTQVPYEDEQAAILMATFIPFVSD